MTLLAAFITRRLRCESLIAIAVAAVVFSLAGLAPAEAGRQVGKASWYSLTSKTASGERCNPAAMTAAHRTLPFGTRVRVQHMKTGRSVVVRINDRGPFIGGRIIDLTKGAAQRLGIVGRGVAHVSVTPIGRVASPRRGRDAAPRNKTRLAAERPRESLFR